MRFASFCSALVLLGACAGQTLYPSRPPATAGEARADPTPSRLVVHTTIGRAALEKLLDQLVPKKGAGTVPILGSDHNYEWSRKSVSASFEQGRISIKAHVDVNVALVVQNEIGLDLRVLAEPVVAADYGARLQSVSVDVVSSDRRMKIAQSLGGALDLIKDQIATALRDFRYDLRPILTDVYDRIGKPIDLSIGDAKGCARFDLLGIEAGPTVLADGIEKDLAFLVSPSITFPCAESGAKEELPPLQNVASLPSGTFTVQLPVAARYEELQSAMTMAFPNGKLHFAKDFPSLYLEKPEIYPSKDELVVKLHINGRIDKYGIHTKLNGDLFMRGHPAVVDNELRVPDLEPTIETSSFLLKLKAALDGDSIRDQARAALRLDLGERIAEVRGRLSTEFAFETGPGAPKGCLRAAARKIELTGVHPHGGYVRVYVQITGQAALHLPCPAAKVAGN